MAEYRKGRPLVTTPAEWRACVGKKAYPSKRNAEGIVRAMNKRFGDTQHAYRCRHCGRFHTGHRRAA